MTGVAERRPEGRLYHRSVNTNSETALGALDVALGLEENGPESAECRVGGEPVRVEWGNCFSASGSARVQWASLRWKMLWRLR
jgi:hypothetical protein